MRYHTPTPEWAASADTVPLSVTVEHWNLKDQQSQ